MKRIIFLIFVTVLSLSKSYGQADIIKVNQKRISDGHIEEVRNELPNLMSQYPNNHGVLFLKGITTSNPRSAIAAFATIYTEDPASQWADDAFSRVVMLYVTIGDFEKARLVLGDFKKYYSHSDLYNFASDFLRTYEDLIQKSILEIDYKGFPEISGDNGTSGVYYCLQVAVFKTRENAVKELDRYKKLRVQARIIEKIVDDSVMFSVVVGKYPSESKAQSSVIVVKNICNCEPIIINYIDTESE